MGLQAAFDLSVRTVWLKLQTANGTQTKGKSKLKQNGSDKQGYELVASKK